MHNACCLPLNAELASIRKRITSDIWTQTLGKLYIHETRGLGRTFGHPPFSVCQVSNVHPETVDLSRVHVASALRRPLQSRKSQLGGILRFRHLLFELQRKEEGLSSEMNHFTRFWCHHVGVDFSWHAWPHCRNGVALFHRNAVLASLKLYPTLPDSTPNVLADAFP